MPRPVYLLLIISYAFILPKLYGQSVNIGFTTTTPRAPLEIRGVAGTGSTAGIIGGHGHGISIQKNWPTIGFNQYRDINGPTSHGKYISTGYAALMTFDNSTSASGFHFVMFPSGNANTEISSGITALSIGGNNGHKILTSLNSDTDCGLTVGRGTGPSGTAMFYGTEYNSHFNYGNEEHTYIRGGKYGSDVFLGESVPGMTVYIGQPNGNTKVGVNYTAPVYTMEVRQMYDFTLQRELGLSLFAQDYMGAAWDWWVGWNDLYLYRDYYSASSPQERYLKTHFSYLDGRLYPVSDRRVKKNIHELPALLDQLAKLNSVTYDFADGPKGEYPELGFIAQEVESLFPLLVKGNNLNNNKMALNYGRLSVIAVKGIQEEQQLLELTGKELDRAEEKIKKLEQLVQSRSSSH